MYIENYEKLIQYRELCCTQKEYLNARWDYIFYRFLLKLDSISLWREAYMFSLVSSFKDTKMNLMLRSFVHCIGNCALEVKCHKNTDFVNAWWTESELVVYIWNIQICQLLEWERRYKRKTEHYHENVFLEDLSVFI